VERVTVVNSFLGKIVILGKGEKHLDLEAKQQMAARTTNNSNRLAKGGRRIFQIPRYWWYLLQGLLRNSRDE